MSANYLNAANYELIPTNKLMGMMIDVVVDKKRVKCHGRSVKRLFEVVIIRYDKEHVIVRKYT